MTSKQLRTPSDFFNTALGRHTVGFDQFLNEFLSTKESACNGGYPPYNMARLAGKEGEDTQYEITLAIAGFTEQDIDITVEHNQLKISGRSGVLTDSSDEVEYLHKGIAERSFTRTFKMADDIEVDSAELQNGILKIRLVQVVPEQLQAKRIPINSK